MTDSPKRPHQGGVDASSVDDSYHSFSFVVSSVNELGLWEKRLAGFGEASGLSQSARIIKHRLDDGQHIHKSPGILKVGDVALKRGIVSMEFAQWCRQALTSGRKRDFEITLRDEKRREVFVWRVRSAFPVKITAPDLTATGSDVAVEQLVLSHEGIECQECGDKDR